MKHLKGFFKVCAFVLMLTMVAPTTLHISNATVAQAATAKLNKKALNLEVGQSFTLEITGTKSNITWASSKKSVATVSKKGKVTAKKAGTATITATVNKKSYTCKVTVEAKELDKKPVYEAKVVSCGAITVAIPEDWESGVIGEQGDNLMVAFYPKNADMASGSSNINILVQKTGTPTPDYKSTKAVLQKSVTKELITSQLAQSGLNATLSGFKTSDYKAKLGTAFKISYKASYKAGEVNGTFTQTIYNLFLDNYLVQVTVTDIGDGVTPNVNYVGEDILNSVKVN